MLKKKKTPSVNKKDPKEIKKKVSVSKLTQDTEFFSGITGYYNGPAIFQCSDGYSKLFRLMIPKTISDNEWKEDVKSFLRFKCRFFVWNEEEDVFDFETESDGKGLNKVIYMIVTKPAEIVDDVIADFNDISKNVHCSVEPLSIADAFVLLSKVTRRRKTFSSSSRLTDFIPKYNERPDRLTFENSDVKFMSVSGFPGYVFPSLIPELLRLSAKICVSVCIDPIDIDQCLAGAELDSVTSDREKKKCIATLKRCAEEDLSIHSVGVYLSIETPATPLDIDGKRDLSKNAEIVDVVKKIHYFAKKFGLTINDFYGQQRRAFKSYFPLGKPVLSMKKALTSENIMGILPWSPQEKIESGVTYGTTFDTERVVQLDRSLISASGMILSSDPETASKAAKQEISFIKTRSEILAVTAGGDKNFQANDEYLDGFKKLMISSSKYPFWHKDKEKNKWLLYMLCSISLKKDRNKQTLYQTCLPVLDTPNIHSALKEMLSSLKSVEATMMLDFIEDHEPVFMRISDDIKISENTIWYVNAEIRDIVREKFRNKIVLDNEADAGNKKKNRQSDEQDDSKEEKNIEAMLDLRVNDFLEDEYALIYASIYSKIQAKYLYMVGAEKICSEAKLPETKTIFTGIVSNLRKFYLTAGAKQMIETFDFIWLLYHDTKDRILLTQMIDLEKEEVKSMGRGMEILITTYNNYILKGESIKREENKYVSQKS